MTIFLDTVGLLAIWDESDQWHKAAQLCFSKLLADRTNFVTSSFVLLECGNAAARRPYRSTVGRLRQQMELSQTLIIPTAEDWRTAWAAYTQGKTDSAGIVDNVSFSVMRRLGITKAFTNDGHFRTAGLETLF